MSEAMEGWRETVARVQRQGRCPCGRCVPYPEPWDAPDGWVEEPGWGMVQAEVAYAPGGLGDEDETAGVEVAPDDPWT